MDTKPIAIITIYWIRWSFVTEEEPSFGIFDIFMYTKTSKMSNIQTSRVFEGVKDLKDIPFKTR